MCVCIYNSSGRLRGHEDVPISFFSVNLYLSLHTHTLSLCVSLLLSLFLRHTLCNLIFISVSLDNLYMGLSVGSQVLCHVFSLGWQHRPLSFPLTLPSALLLMQHVACRRAAVIYRGSVIRLVIILDEGRGNRVKNGAGHGN